MNRPIACPNIRLNDQEARLHAIVGNPVPHYACFASGYGVLKVDLLAGVQRGIGMHGAKSALLMPSTFELEAAI